MCLRAQTPRGGRPHARPGRPRGGRRVGRPPRIDRAAIAAAAADMPLEEITLRSVAERLGVSVPSLYHYVSGRADLLRLAAEESAVRMTLPRDHGQHWAVWCYEWADYVRRAFVADPALLGEFLNGAFGPEWMAAHMDTAIGVCARGGLPDRAGLEAFTLVSECALGAAISEVHFARGRGRPAGRGRAADAGLPRPRGAAAPAPAVRVRGAGPAVVRGWHLGHAHRHRGPVRHGQR